MVASGVSVGNDVVTVFAAEVWAVVCPASDEEVGSEKAVCIVVSIGSTDELSSVCIVVTCSVEAVGSDDAVWKVVATGSELVSVMYSVCIVVVWNSSVERGNSEEMISIEVCAGSVVNVWITVVNGLVEDTGSTDSVSRVVCAVSILVNSNISV